jgi:predicted DNA-binding antitoxin AbrB/MazE fold protein
MMKTIRAIYENGVLRLREHASSRKEKSYEP